MANSVIQPIDQRRARRALSSQPIPRDALASLIRAAHLAPSCANNQPWRFVVIDDPKILSEVKTHLSKGNYWAAPSPAIVALASHEELDCRIPDGRRYHLFGCGLAAMNLMLQATHLGLTAHPIAGFKQAPIKEILGIPGEYTLITLVILGHPTDDDTALSDKHRIEETSQRTRADVSVVCSWNQYASTDDTRSFTA